MHSSFQEPLTGAFVFDDVESSRHIGRRALKSLQDTNNHALMGRNVRKVVAVSSVFLERYPNYSLECLHFQAMQRESAEEPPDFASILTLPLPLCCAKTDPYQSRRDRNINSSKKCCLRCPRIEISCTAKLLRKKSVKFEKNAVCVRPSCRRWRCR